MRSMNDKSRSQNLKVNHSTTNDILKKQLTLQKQASKQYLKFKKSASQPAYFLNKSRLKRLSDIYRAVSLQKLARHSSFHNSNSKSIHNSITPEKKQSGLLHNNSSSYNNNSLNFKRNNSKLNSLNMNNIFENTQKTKRLTLNRQNPNTIDNSQPFFQSQNSFKILLTIIDKLEEISHLTIEKVFLSQYNNLFDLLKDQSNHKKNNVDTNKTLISKFCCLIDFCQKKKIRLKQKQIKMKYQKVQESYSNSIADIKKKTLKIQLMVKQIQHLKSNNNKLLKDISQMKQQKKALLALNIKPATDKKIKNKNLQITQVFQLCLLNQQTQIQSPINLHKFSHKNPNQSKRNIKSDGYISHNNNNNKNIKNKDINILYNSVNQTNSNNIKNDQSNTNTNNNNNFRQQKLQFIKKIRNLQKKQKDLMKTLIVLRSDGIDVQRAFQQVLTGQGGDIQVQENALQFTKKTRIPKYIRNIKNKDSFQADSSIIQSIDGLTLRYIEGQDVNQEEIFFPIKHQYKSKPLSQEMQKKLKLDFNVLYDDYQYCDETENSRDNQEVSDSDTG